MMQNVFLSKKECQSNNVKQGWNKMGSHCCLTLEFVRCSVLNSSSLQFYVDLDLGNKPEFTKWIKCIKNCQNLTRRVLSDHFLILLPSPNGVSHHFWQKQETNKKGLLIYFCDPLWSLMIQQMSFSNSKPKFEWSSSLTIVDLVSGKKMFGSYL